MVKKKEALDQINRWDVEENTCLLSLEEDAARLIKNGFCWGQG